MVDVDASGGQGESRGKPANEIAKKIVGGDVLEWWMWIHRKRPAEEGEPNPLMKKLGGGLSASQRRRDAGLVDMDTSY